MLTIACRLQEMKNILPLIFEATEPSIEDTFILKIIPLLHTGTLFLKKKLLIALGAKEAKT